MRKWILISCLSVLSALTIIISCSKTDTKTPDRSSANDPGPNGLTAEYVTPPPGGSTTCNCPTGWASCNTSCFFSNCCICWDPNTSEGSCGCYFGIALCKSGKKGTNGASLSGENDDGKKSNHKIHVFPGRLREFLKFLQTENFNYQTLESGYEELIKSTDAASDPENPQVSVTNYQKFSDEYVNFISQLNTLEREKVLTYVNQKSKAVNSK